ncbi:hypothetical protein [Photobacterium sp. OFAV2-7]|uniref:hypothetical protein n=1 Tax=Photobacterium sp. OFAV2-7 TaxID=2917748 RepID=UPI001EF612FD|nr:hypothetical protein [Photobacterium sp. OFAV2-7]MCG7588284.1 hypothetical protein [Photobacterium sp. OFAV2-7]
MKRPRVAFTTQTVPKAAAEELIDRCRQLGTPIDVSYYDDTALIIINQTHIPRLSSHHSFIRKRMCK